MTLSSLRLAGVSLNIGLLQARFLFGQREGRCRREILRRMVQVIAARQGLARFRNVGLASADPAQRQTQKGAQPHRPLAMIRHLHGP